MSRIAFPLLGTFVVFLLVVPAATLAAKAALVAWRRRTGRLSGFGGTFPWLLMVVPVATPVPWFVSAAVHQSEGPGGIAACLNDHLAGGACVDALVFAAGVTVLLLFAAAHCVHRHVGGARGTGLALPDEHPAARRLAVVCQRHPLLRDLRVAAVEREGAALSTRGLLRPRVEVSRGVMAALDDGALASALLHEAQHVRGRDPLRYLIAAICLSLNPLAVVLRGELVRWRLAREAACDEGAVRCGGEPLSLAHAIVVAARSSAPAPSWQALLGSPGVSAVRARVALLLGEAEGGASGRGRWEAPLGALAGILTIATALPHVLGSGPLDRIHLGIEKALVLLGIL